jgi:toxin-antitoxin system PIN domain toxin
VRLVDANLLVYAFARAMPQHARCRTWLDARLNDEVPLGLPWPSLVAFVRLVTNPRVFPQPVAVPVAWRQVEEWLACPPVWIPQPTERHAELLGRLLAGSGMRATLVQDAHLAALALEHGLAVASADADFARFQGLRWENPLAGAP